MAKTYTEIQKENEEKALKLLRYGKSFFKPYEEAGLWLACHRLKNKGIVKESAVSNCFTLVENKKI